MFPLLHLYRRVLHLRFIGKVNLIFDPFHDTLLTTLGIRIRVRHVRDVRPDTSGVTPQAFELRRRRGRVSFCVPSAAVVSDARERDLWPSGMEVVHRAREIDGYDTEKFGNDEHALEY